MCVSRTRAERIGYAGQVRVFSCVLCCLCLAAWLRVSARAHAQDTPLHEYIPAISPSEARATARGVSAGEDSADARAPAADGGEGAQRNAAPVQPNQENFRPDRSTSLEGGLDYYEAFDPAIAPFKRVTGFDAVRLDVDGKTPVLGVSDTRRRVVTLAGAAADARPRDHFTGQLDLSFREQRVQPFPAVSPESRLLSMRTEPSVSVQIERDGADNLFIRALGAVPDEPVRVRWETDAPRTYFGTDVPRVPLRQLPAIAHVDASIARRALRFAAELGVTPRSDLRRALEKLTEHFRNFVESSEPPANTGDLYLDLSRGGKGLCRHRAYGFVVTARALGINARFVQNEAHSWVEVELPDLGFLRIDLGGATHGLTAHDTGERSSYVPAQPDTLPRPAAYRQSYARAAREKAGNGSSPEPEELASLSGRWLPDEANRNGSSNASVAAGGGEGPQPTAAETETVQNGKRPVRLSLEDRRLSALRGGKVVLTGQAQDDAGRGVAGLRVELWIQHAQRKQRMLLAVQVTDNDGNFRADFGVPPDLAVGDYKLVARTDGDSEHLPASSDSP